MQVVCGELGESVLEQLSSLSQEVVLPLLSNPANHVGISDGVGREVQDRLHQFIADGAQLNSSVSEDVQLPSHCVSSRLVFMPLYQQHTLSVWESD